MELTMRTEYIARISYGKDSLKMLDVIWTRGLPLDRITTTDVWATDTISANLPPLDEFKKRMDEKIYQLYGIRVEHLCARNKDGTKRTYEQMFYHVPNRRLRIVHVERESRFESDDPRGFPMNGVPWCQPLLKKPPTPPAMESAGNHYRISAEHRVQLLSEAQAGTGFRYRFLRGAGKSRSIMCGLFGEPRHGGGENKYRGIFRHSS